VAIITFLVLSLPTKGANGRTSSHGFGKVGVEGSLGFDSKKTNLARCPEVEALQKIDHGDKEREGDAKILGEDGEN
jgi:hypothetical protein